MTNEYAIPDPPELFVIAIFRGTREIPREYTITMRAAKIKGREREGDTRLLSLKLREASETIIVNPRYGRPVL